MGILCSKADNLVKIIKDKFFVGYDFKELSDHI